MLLRIVLNAACLFAGAPALCASLPPTDPAMDQGSQDAASTLFASPTTRDHIGRVVLPVMINGRGPFRFVVDTGANHSTISPRLVKELGLQPTHVNNAMLEGITGSAQVSFVKVEQVRSGDFTTGEVALPVVWAPVMAGADGIFGAAALSHKSLVVDFQRNRVSIMGHVDAGMRADAVRIHAPRLAQGLVALAAHVGRVPVVAILDTGAERSLGNQALHEALHSHQKAGGIALVTSVYGATEEVDRGEIERAPPIYIESLHIDDVSLVFGDFHIFKIWELEDRPAMIIGMDVLGTVASLGFDFENDYVYVTSVRSRTERPLGAAGDLNQQMQKH